MSNKTLQQYDNILSACREIFRKKIHDYGASWRVLRPTSITDQIFIKAKRIKTIEEIGVQKVSDSIEDELKGIINYSIIALIQLEKKSAEENDLAEGEALKLYDEKASETRALMSAKNHDYGEAWRDMRPTSFTDMVMMKLLRLKQIENNNGKTLVSEGSESHYKDIINYAVFALIQLEEKQKLTQE